MNYIHQLQPEGTNSTHFTLCCDCAITDGEPNCPLCKEPVIGWDAESKHERRKIRWAYATNHWRTK